MRIYRMQGDSHARLASQLLNPTVGVGQSWIWQIDTNEIHRQRSTYSHLLELVGRGSRWVIHDRVLLLVRRIAVAEVYRGFTTHDSTPDT